MIVYCVTDMFSHDGHTDGWVTPWVTRRGNGVVLGGKGRFSTGGKTMARSVRAMGRPV